MSSTKETFSLLTQEFDGLAVDSYKAADWPEVASLLRAWPFKQFSNHSAWKPEKLNALCLARAQEMLNTPDAVAWIARSDAAPLGFALLTFLPWDTERIGIPAARVDYLVAGGTYVEQTGVKQALLDAIVQHSEDQSIRHLSVRSNGADLSSTHVLEQRGFITVDGILTYALDLEQAIPQANSNGSTRNVRTRLATEADTEVVADLARTIYLHDRFHSDPSIEKGQADGVYADWMRNSCSGRVADAVILSEDEQGPLGYVTCKLVCDTKEYLDKLIGTIVLVGTAERARGKGCAHVTLDAALAWFRSQGAEIVEVGTQFGNVSASRLYESCGFRLVNSSMTLRFCLKRP